MLSRETLKARFAILSWVALFSLLSLQSFSRQSSQTIPFDFYGDTLQLPAQYLTVVDYNGPLSDESIRDFYSRMLATDYKEVVQMLLAYKLKNQPDDWLFYQLIRKTAQMASPKKDNYYRYTLYKWFLLNQSGYDATLCIAGDKLLFYVQSDENIYDIPYYKSEGKQYVCLNYHDYGNIDIVNTELHRVEVDIAGQKTTFSYRLTHMPKFKPADYKEKDLEFNYHDVEYHIKLKTNEQVKTILANYPVTDYKDYFNLPLSNGTYTSLIPQLRDHVKKMKEKDGVDYLMQFTRYAFAYEPDKENFGKEKHLSAEQTLLYDHSDCEDRAALFYYLVKEIYNLPMVVLAYPHHLTVAVKFDKPVGKQLIEYNGGKYSICEPTPQAQDLPIGKMSQELKKEPYEVVLAYDPSISGQVGTVLDQTFTSFHLPRLK